MPAKFAEKFTVVQAKSGESAKLECNATGDQPLTVNWFKDDALKLSKRGGDNFEIYETTSDTGLNSVLVVRTVSRADGLTYKCVAENEYGNDERLIKLMVVEAPSRPMNLKVKDAWSKSAALTWSAPYAGNSPILNYIIQYWRKQANENQGIQNYRRQEFTVSGTQTSALISNLTPAVTYEASVIAVNQVGRSESSDNILINTNEDDPAAPPSDVSAESRGPTTIKVSWKVPPVENWNGPLLGFYIGYKQRSTLDSLLSNSLTKYSFKTVHFVKGQSYYESFLTNLAKGQEYEIIVKVFNSIGAGPESHVMSVRTLEGDLPSPPSLFSHAATQSSINLRWTYPNRAQSPVSSIKRYIIYYQRVGDDSWLEIGVPVGERGANDIQGLSDASSGSYILTGLESGSTYKIYVVAANQEGMGDPSNIVTTKTDQISGTSFSENLRSSMGSVDLNVFEMNRQFQLVLIMSVITTIFLVIAIVFGVLYCGKRMQNPALAQQQAGQPNSGTWGPENTMQIGQRYVEFDKPGIMKNNSLMTNTQTSDHTSAGQGSNPAGCHYPLPYGTLPMNVVISDQKPWDRPHSIMVKEPLKPQVTHIYDSPQ